MAAVVLGVATVNTGNNADVVSASMASTSGDRLVAFVFFTGNVGAFTCVDSLSGTPWEEVTAATALKATSADRMRTFVRPAASTGAAMTVTGGRTGNASGGGVVVLRVSGVTRLGSALIRQSAKQDNQAGATTPAPVFSVAALTGNPTAVAVFNASNPAAVTPNASWTERADTGYATPTTGIEVASRDSGFTGTTITGANVSTLFGSVAIEIDVTPPPVTSTGASTTAVDASSATARESSVGTGASTTSAGTSAGTGLVANPVTGAGASTTAVDASVATARETFAGVGADTTTADVSAATARETFTGAGAPTTALDASAGAGLVLNPVTGAGASTTAADTSAAAAKESFTGSGATATAADASSAVARETIVGAGAATTAVDAGAGTGSVANPITGAGAGTTASDVSAGAATETITGAAASTTPPDASSGLARETITAAGASTTIPDSAAGAATAISNVAGAGAGTTTGDVSAAVARETVIGGGASTASGDTSDGAAKQTFVGVGASTATVDASSGTAAVSAAVSPVGVGATTTAADASTATGTVTIAYTSPGGILFSVIPGLNLARLRNALRRYMDPSYVDFEGFPADDDAAAFVWANAMSEYTLGGGMVPPSANGAVAYAALLAGLSGMAAPGGFLALMDAAFAAYALSIASGMSATHVGTPPVTPVSLTLLPIISAGTLPPGGPYPSATTQITALALAIDTWFRTGTATPNAGGPSATWA